MDQINGISSVSLQLQSIKSSTVGSASSTVRVSENNAFGNVLNTLASEAIAQTPQNPSKTAEQDDVAKSFETMIISEFLNEFFKEGSESVFGEGIQGDFFATHFSKAVAEQISERGGLGFSRFI